MPDDQDSNGLWKLFRQTLQQQTPQGTSLIRGEFCDCAQVLHCFHATTCRTLCSQVPLGLGLCFYLFDNMVHGKLIIFFLQVSSVSNYLVVVQIKMQEHNLVIDKNCIFIALNLWRNSFICIIYLLFIIYLFGK